jgi:cystathionine beta-lyase/cystathionine gamma-synthase
MTHASIPREERIKNGLTDSLMRLSVGIEDADDLIEDLDQAIEKSSTPENSFRTFKKENAYVL